MAIQNKNECGTKIVSVENKAGIDDFLFINKNGYSKNGIQITPEIAGLIIQELAVYLVEKTNEK